MECPALTQRRPLMRFRPGYRGLPSDHPVSGPAEPQHVVQMLVDHKRRWLGCVGGWLQSFRSSKETTICSSTNQRRSAVGPCCSVVEGSLGGGVGWPPTPPLPLRCSSGWWWQVLERTQVFMSTPTSHSLGYDPTL